jgi:hypothetical protein
MHQNWPQQTALATAVPSPSRQNIHPESYRGADKDASFCLAEVQLVK